MAYKLNSHDIHNFAGAIHAETRQKGEELFFKYCPYCNGGTSKDKDTFSVNLDNGTYNCFRSSCGVKGHFVELARDFDYQLDYGEDSKQKVYRSLPQKPIVVRNKAVEYMAARGISEKIVKQYNITTQKNKESILVFPFYDENNILAFVKYRDTQHEKGKGSKEWCERDTKPILFGMNHCTGFNRLIVTEGQIDSLTLAECGVNNAVSVPTGAQGFTFLNHVWEWLTKFKEIVIFGDYERGKMSLLDEFQNRMPNEVIIKAVRREDYLDKKDANDIYRAYGKQAVYKAVHNAELQPIKQIKRLADVKAVDLYRLPKLKTSLPELDKTLSGGLYFGQLILLTGKRGEGKSTFMSQIIAESLNQGHPVLAYSGELTDYHFKNWLDLQLAGRERMSLRENDAGDKMSYLEPSVSSKISNWYADMAYIYDNSFVDDETEGLLDVAEQAICRQGVKVVCFDNLMTAIEISPNGNLYHAQSDFIKRLAQMARKYNIIIILVAHPRKSSGQVGNDDVSGSSDLTNAVDVVLSYERNDNKHNYEDCDSHLSVLKNRLTGKRLYGNEAIRLYFDRLTKRISSPDSIISSKSYGWDRQALVYKESEWEEI